MKIVTVTMVKNEENIVESFVRHAFSFSDHIIIFNHNSTDGTENILRALQNEFESSFTIYPEIMKTTMTINQEMFNHMIKYAFEQLDADIVLPLDSDEFPVLLQGENLRDYLEKLDQTKCYKVHFLPFAIAEEWKNDVFVPLLFERHKKVSIANDFKVFLTRKMYFEYEIEVGLGNHLLYGKKQVPDELVKDLYPELFYAHFAFRSREHLESKIVIRWLSLIMRNDVVRGMAFQYQAGYEKLIHGQELSPEEIDWFCLNNMCMGIEHPETLDEIQNLIEKSDTRKLFENVELKYAHMIQQKSRYVLLMEFVQQVIGQYKEEKKCKEQEIFEKEKIVSEKLQLSKELEELTVQLKEENCKVQNLEQQYLQMRQRCEELEQNLRNIKSSKAWKLIQMYRKLVGKYDPAQD